MAALEREAAALLKHGNILGGTSIGYSLTADGVGYDRSTGARLLKKIKLLEVTDVAGDFSVATNKTEALLQTYPDLNAIFAVSAEGAPAAAGVLKQQGKAGKILLAGFDDLKDTLEGIKDGTIAFCLVQKTFKMGWLSVEALMDAGKGKTLPKVTDTGVLFVTKANVNNYMADMKKEFVKQ